VERTLYVRERLGVPPVNSVNNHIGLIAVFNNITWHVLSVKF